MILLAATTHRLEVVTGQAVTVDVHASVMDATNADPPAVKGSTSGPIDTAISTATTTIVVPAPAVSTLRKVKVLTIRNKSASASVDVRVQHVMAGTAYELHSVTLPAQAMLMYVEGVGFFTIPQSQANPLLTSSEQDGTQRVLSNNTLATGALGTFTMVSGTAYWVYLGRIVRDTIVKYVELQLTTLGAGGQTAEVGLFSSPAAPNKTAQTMTKIIATGTVDSLTVGLGTKRNTVSFDQLVAAGTHLWAGFRQVMVTTQTIVAGLAGDMSEGHLLSLAAAGALTGAGPFTPAIPAIGTATIGPMLRATLD